ncbi:hypothetical protein [Pedobacter sp. UYEF25]
MNHLADQFIDASYSKLFQSGDHSLVDSLWDDGRNSYSLLEIVSKNDCDDYARLLASEVLFAKQKDYPPKALEDTLAYIYSKALFITGDNAKNYRLAGNLWGFMYFSEQNKITDFGILGSHLMVTRRKAIPYLIDLLTNSQMFFYEGSQEATIGNNLKYRVKDAAAFYIGKISGISVKYHDTFSDRDLEIERLKEALKLSRQ